MKFISEKLKEPLILEREDWEWSEGTWNVFERLFDCNNAERIVVKDATIEAYIREAEDEE